jgi:hypothetical protein
MSNDSDRVFTCHCCPAVLLCVRAAEEMGLGKTVSIAATSYQP